MNFHLHQTRAFNLPNAFEISGSMVSPSDTPRWDPESILFVTDEIQESNVLEILEGLLDKEKTYKVGNSDFTGEQILGRVDATFTGTEGQTVYSGCHRALAMAMLQACCGITVEPVTRVIPEEDALRVAHESNARHEFVTKLEDKAKLEMVIELAQQKVYTREADLPYKRGTSQKLWAQASLVLVHDVPIEEAMKLNKEKARKAGKASDVEAAVQEALANTKNAPKILSSKVMREAMEDVAKYEGDDPYAIGAKEVLTMIIEANEIGFKALVAQTFKS